MEIDLYYEPCVFLEEMPREENKSTYKSSEESDEPSISTSMGTVEKPGWFVVQPENYSFPQNVSEDDPPQTEEDATLLREINKNLAELSVSASATYSSLQTLVSSSSSLLVPSSLSATTSSLVTSFRKRDSWNASFTSVVTTLRLVGHNPLLSTLSIPTLQLLTDQLDIPSWLPTLPPGVSSTLSTHPSGEWFFPTETGLKIRKNAQPDCMRGRYILYVHGGAFCCCHTGTHRGLLHALVHQTGASVLSVNYRRPPEHPYPTPVHDCLSAYLFLLEKVGDSSQIFFAGDSAGGTLVINTLILVAQHELPPPAGAVLLSPWVDLSDSGHCASWQQYRDVDYLSPDLAEMFARSYVGDSLEVQSLSPLYSPLLHLLPPLLVEFGQCEVLHDQILAFCEQAEQAGVDIKYTAREDMVHVFPIYNFTGMQQCQDAFDEIISFFDEISSRHGGGDVVVGEGGDRDLKQDEAEKEEESEAEKEDETRA